MAAFDRVLSGYPSMDQVLDYIRLGDNVVIQVTGMDEFRFFVEPYVEQAKKDGRNLIYFRFASHAPLVKKEDAKWYCLDPGEGFEQFTIRVHRIIEKEGRDAFYVFDCLSELQVAWAADLMMGNFFCVTCPFLFILDTVAMFPVIRGDHSHETIARIQETTQLFLDVYSDEKNIYLHPVKVWNRYSATMFLPHRADKQEKVFTTLTDSVSMSRYYWVVGQYLSTEDQNLDSWERYFQKSRTCEPSQEEEIKSNFCRMMMTKDSKIREMFGKFFEIKDYYRVKDRLIGSGKIGGKSCGMLLSRSIVQKCLPELSERMEPHDSFYIGSHVFYTYLVYNKLWDLHVAQKEKDRYYELAGQLSDGILHGVFPEAIRSQLRRMLEYYGQAPIIARSSSMLEDGFGNAFAGKYESVFCANQGTPEERLEKLEDAIRIVYASAVDPSALEYRRNRGLDALEEQMSILVQRVSGSMHGTYFFPSAAGVGYSYDTYGCSQNLDPEKGMLRMVYGLGTRAVDRTDNDYPRIIHIDKPEHTYLTTMNEKVRFSQRKLDVIHLEKKDVVEISLEEMMKVTPRWYHNLVLEHDREMEQNYYNTRGVRRDICFGTCHGYVKNRQFLKDMELILATLEREYTYPVDIEFTVNSNERKEFVICLLQCRPLQVFSGEGKIEIPDIPQEKILFETTGSSMGKPQQKQLDAVVLVDAKAYYDYPYRQKPEVADLLTMINTSFRGSGKNVLLMVPGRIGTSSPELGIPVKFAGISQFCAIVEMDDDQSGYSPELSFGSHMFQDLVEAEIFYTALLKTGKEGAEKREKLLSGIGKMCELPESYRHLSDMVHVYQTEEAGLTLYYDMDKGRTVCGISR